MEVEAVGVCGPCGDVEAQYRSLGSMSAKRNEFDIDISELERCFVWKYCLSRNAFWSVGDAGECC